MGESVSEPHEAHASSLHEPSYEPLRRVVLDSKHSVYTLFPKDRNCEIWQRTKSQGLVAEDALVESYF